MRDRLAECRSDRRSDLWRSRTMYRQRRAQVVSATAPTAKAVICGAGNACVRGVTVDDSRRRSSGRRCSIVQWMSRAERVMTILVAEDDPDDRYLIAERHFAKAISGTTSSLSRMARSLLLYLFAPGPIRRIACFPIWCCSISTCRASTDVMALAEIKAHPDTRRIPVVVFHHVQRGRRHRPDL